MAYGMTTTIRKIFLIDFVGSQVILIDELMHNTEFLYQQLIVNYESQMLEMEEVPHLAMSNVAVRDSLHQREEGGIHLNEDSN